MHRTLVLLWALALALSMIDWAVSGWSDPQPQFRFWTYIAGPVLVLTGFRFRRQVTRKLWVITVAAAVAGGGLWLMTICIPADPTHQCYQTLAQRWLPGLAVFLLYVGFPLCITIAAVATIRVLERRSRPDSTQATA